MSREKRIRARPRKGRPALLAVLRSLRPQKASLPDVPDRAPEAVDPCGPKKKAIRRRRRTGFLAGEIRVLDDFDRMDEKRIARLFGGRK